MRIWFLFLAFLSSPVCAQQQTITAGNAASLSSNVAPGSILRVQIIGGGPSVINPDPARVAVRLQPAGSERVYESQAVGSPMFVIWAVVPEDMPLGTANVTAVIGGTPTAAAPVNVVAADVGLFTVSRNGLGPALAQNDDVVSPPVLNQLTVPALPGQYVTLWATGLGRLATPDVTLDVAGKPVRPSYAGRAPGLPGVDQINFPLPADVPDGCYVPVRVRAGESVSNVVTLAKAGSTGACAHPLGLAGSDLRKLDDGGYLLVGSIAFDSSIVLAPSGSATVGSPGGPGTNGYTRSESVTAWFLDRSAFDLYLLSQPQEPEAQYYSCRLSNTGAVAVLLFGGANDAGPSLNTTGPGSKHLDVPRVGAGDYYSKTLDAVPTVDSVDQLPAPFFSAGGWEVTAPGGATIAPFQQLLTLPPPLHWTNRASLGVISRVADATVTWDPQGYSESDSMTVTLASGGFRSLLLPAVNSSGLTCRAPAQAGRLVLPREFLQLIGPAPATPFFPTTGVLSLRAARKPEKRIVFSLPLASGGTRAPAVVDYSYADTIRVSVQ